VAETQRFQMIDLLRGVAIALMIYYHFSYDLNHFGYLRLDFYHDAYWLNLRTAIVSMFLFLVGISLVLATQQGINLSRYLRRLGLLLLFSIIISVNSYFMFPGRTVLIGILHFIAIASVLGLLFIRLYWPSLLLGLALIVLDYFFQHTFFDPPWIHWLGLMTHKPQTEDYVPLIPWFGVVLLGIFSGQTLLCYPVRFTFLKSCWNNPLAVGLASAGRYSLWVYLLHQPILFGTLWAVSLF